MNNNEPIVLGKIQKGKTGKPLVVLIIFLFAGSIVLFLPTISGYFGDYNILDLVMNGQIIDFFVNHDNYVDKPISNKTTTTKLGVEPVLINSKTVIEYSNLVLSNFELTIQNIKFDVNSNVNLDESNYYLVLEKNNKIINYIKIVSGNNDFKFINNLIDTVEVKGYVKIMKENEYPVFNLSGDNIKYICEKDNIKYEYTFTNNLLLKVKETFKYNSDDLEEYYDIYQNYSNKVNKINENSGISSISENVEGFIFESEIDFNTYTGQLEKNYYSLNTKSNKISFEMKAKGYDCK